jgi:hypothetical protein
MKTPYELQLKRIADSFVGTNIEKAGKTSKMAPEQLSKIARQLSHEELQRTISSSPHDHHRVAAHSELDRRTKEESPQEEESSMDTKVRDESKKDKMGKEKNKKSKIKKSRDILGLNNND